MAGTQGLGWTTSRALQHLLEARGWTACRGLRVPRRATWRVFHYARPKVIFSVQHQRQQEVFPNEDGPLRHGKAVWTNGHLPHSNRLHYQATMKSLLLLLPLLVLGVRAGPYYTEIYSGVDQSGYSVYLDTLATELYTYGMDDDIESVKQTGMWIYYENYSFNPDTTGSVYFVHGIDIAVTFPAEYQNIVSSLRHAGDSETLNGDMIMFFEGTAFTGYAFFATADASFLGPLAGTVSSILVTGSSPWTVYTGDGYTGSSWCVYNTDHDVGSDGSTLDLGIFPSVEESGVPDNSIMAVRKGCYAARVAEAPKLQVEGRQEHGAWGRLV